MASSRFIPKVFLTLYLLILFSALCSCTYFPSILLSKLALDYVHYKSSGCSISINGGLPEHQPLILLPDDPPALVLPTPGGVIEVPKDGRLRLACSGSSNVLSIADTQEAIVTCISGTSFIVPTPSGNQTVDFQKLSCTSYPYNTARYRSDRDPDCQAPNSPVEIGFILPKDGAFLRIIDGCFNNRSLDAIYTRFDMPSSISGYQSGFPRPGFMQGDFYGNLKVNSIYSRVKQREVISKILGSEELGLKYIPEKGDYFLSRGHLTAKADFIYGVVQRSTFYFINAAPQWQTFNGANWGTLEVDLRIHAASSKLNLTVWTGTHGVATLPDVNGKDQPLAIYIDENGNQQIKVPALYWKVALEPKSGLAVAFVGVNNPYLNPVPESHILCKTVCDKLPWLKWSPNDLKNGFSYCCEVDELRKTITTIPKFETTGLLT